MASRRKVLSMEVTPANGKGRLYNSYKARTNLHTLKWPQGCFQNMYIASAYTLEHSCETLVPVHLNTLVKHLCSYSATTNRLYYYGNGVFFPHYGDKVSRSSLVSWQEQANKCIWLWSCIRNIILCDSSVYKSKIIPSRISIVSLCLKHRISIKGGAHTRFVDS